MLITCTYYSYLALVAALTSEADFVFIPEDPAPIDWPEKMCKKLIQVYYYDNIFSNKFSFIFNSIKFCYNFLI